jgi:glyoxylate/hydroxypyruvate reductase A
VTTNPPDTLVFYSEIDDPEPWRSGLAKAIPEAPFHVFPDVSDPAAVTTAIVWRPPLGFFAPFTNLRLVVNLGAGVDSLVRRDDLPAGVPIARLSDPGMVAMMTSYVLFAVTRYARDIDILEAAQRRGEWHYLPPRALDTVKVGLLGLGELGQSAAQALARLSIDVTGWSRSPKTVPGIRCVHGLDALDALIASSEILVIMLPLTHETEGLMSEARLRLMPKGAKLVNVARGPVVDEAALIQALADGHLGGATLDVFVREPLPADSPLWRMPNVLITPHLASSPVPDASAKVIAESIRRVRRGESPLHLADPARGY